MVHSAIIMGLFIIIIIIIKREATFFVQQQGKFFSTTTRDDDIRYLLNEKQGLTLFSFFYLFYCFFSPNFYVLCTTGL